MTKTILFWCTFDGSGQALYIVSDFVTNDASQPTALQCAMMPCKFLVLIYRFACVKLCVLRADLCEHQHTHLSPGAHAKNHAHMAVEVWCAQPILSYSTIIQYLV